MDPIFGLHESALLIRARRMDVLARNLANADTPGYKARDMDFTTELSRLEDGTSRLTTTHERHLRSPRGLGSDAELKYRMPHQPSQDGNTVETDLEQSRFAENAVAYQVTLLFLNGRISGLRTAITGGG